MPISVMSRSTIPHSRPTQADMDILSLLTSDQSALGPLSPDNQDTANPSRKKKSLPRRESPMDALLISAVLAGSGPVTRHHFGHGISRPGAYASCDESRPSSPAGTHVPKVIMKSTQAPRSERLRMEHEVKDALERRMKESKISEDEPAVSTTQATAVPIPRPLSLKQDQSSSAFSPSSSSLPDRPKRRMSIDPTPITQALKASPSPFNFFHPNPFIPPKPAHGRIQVRCMARTRIPTPHGELFLHLYHNSHDTKEHLAVVMDPIQLDSEARAIAPKGRNEIRSKTLDAVWHEEETEMERIIRGAYTGRLRPGVTTGKNERPPDVGIENVEDVRALVRIHSECFTGETIGSMRCDCGEQLDEAIHQISQLQNAPATHRHRPTNMPPTPASSRPVTPATSSSHATQSYVPGRGVVIYLRQEGRGIGLLEKIRAYNLQDLGHDTVTANLMLGHGADERKYDVAAEMLRDLGLADEGIRLLTNNPEKVHGLATEGVKVVERVGMVPRDWQCGDDHVHGKEEDEREEREYGDWRMRRAGVGLIGAGKASGPELEKYLRTKVERMGHLIDMPDFN